MLTMMTAHRKRSQAPTSLIHSLTHTHTPPISGPRFMPTLFLQNDFDRPPVFPILLHFDC